MGFFKGFRKGCGCVFGAAAAAVAIFIILAILRMLQF
jgi:hypothetical protein